MEKENEEESTPLESLVENYKEVLQEFQSLSNSFLANVTSYQNNPYQEIIAELDKRSIPGEGLTWERIVTFAAKHHEIETILPTLFNKPEEKEESVVTNAVVLSKDQQAAWAKLQVWVENDDSYFVLKGYAGTGKSFLLKMLTYLNLNIFFTAPTNKATKVLSGFVECDAKTTYSQLGLKMTAEDEKMVLAYGENIPYLPRKSILVVDEASMIGTPLFEFIEETRKRTRCKVLYVGDPAQLPPVGEVTSKSWKCSDKPENRSFLKQVMRYDNQLLVLATRIREQISDKDYSFPVEDDNDGSTGVFLLSSRKEFTKRIGKLTSPEDFASKKLIAWRNKTVTAYNNMIRENLGFEDTFNIGDILLIAEPVEEDNVIIAHIDDEFRVTSITETSIKTSGGASVPVYRLGVKNDELSIFINVPQTTEVLAEILTAKAAKAKQAKGTDRRDAWKDFWETKKQFVQVRYGYALTAHRAQGSSYSEVYIDQQDILSNSEKREALRCLYVACTRATTSVFTY